MTTSGSTDIRKWAREHGLTTAERGRLPKSVLEAYAAAHSGDGIQGRTAPGSVDRSGLAGNVDAGAARASQTGAAGSGAGNAAARTGKGRGARTSAVQSRPSARRAARTAAPCHDLEERLTAVETQLAMAVARLETLEGKMTKSLLGLRVTL